MMRRPFLEAIITSTLEVFKDCESYVAVGIILVGIPTRVTAVSNVNIQQNVGS